MPVQRFSILVATVAFLPVAVAARVASAITFTTLHSFSPSVSCNPLSEVTLDAAGTLYGTASAGGATGDGAIFSISSSGVYSTLHSFAAPVAATPIGGVTLDEHGNLFGTTSLGGAHDQGVLYKLEANTNAYSTLATFNGIGNGANPLSTLRRDADGNFYGTTYNGGAAQQGTYFKYYTDGRLVTYITFDGVAGAHPTSTPIIDPTGNRYGTTASGGLGFGTTFKMAASGAFSNSYLQNNIEGNAPGGLAVDGRGNMYSATADGGGGDPPGSGTIFKIAPDGRRTTVIAFAPERASDVQGPLLIDVAGNLFGTATHGGTGEGGYAGTVFKVSPEGVFTTLVNFNGANGSQPAAGLSVDPRGALYGTTEFGGTEDAGTVFKLTNAGYISLVGDANGDNHVNFDDLVSLAQHYNTTTGNTWATGDFTFDGVVNFDDLVVLAQHYNEALAGTLAAEVAPTFAADWALAQSLVPEPTALAVLALACLLLSRRSGTTQRPRGTPCGPFGCGGHLSP